MWTQYGWDNFVRANGGLGANWTTQTACTAPQISSNKACAGIIGLPISSAMFTGFSPWTADQYSEMVQATASSAGCYILPAVRMSASANTKYELQVSNGSWSLVKYIAGATTVLVAGTAVATSIGDVIRLEIVGTNLTAYKNGVAVGAFTAISDASIATGIPGMGFYVAAGAVTDISCSKWSGGTTTPYGPIIVQGTSHTQNTALTCAAAFPANLTSGSYLLAFVTSLTAGTAPAATIADSAGNVWTQLAFQDLGTGGGKFYIFGAPNTHGVVADTVTATFAAIPTSLSNIGIVEYTGVLNASPVDVIAAFTNATGTSYTGSPVTTARTNDTIVALGYNDNLTAGNIIPGQGYTLRLDTTSGAGYFLLMDAPAIPTGTYTPNLTSSSHQYILGTVALASLAAVAATPTFSPGGGTYTSVQTVTLSTASGGASIYYTLDGTTPTTGSTLYTGPITVGASKTIKAIASGGGFLTSGVGTAVYVINIAVTYPAFPPLRGLTWPVIRTSEWSTTIQRAASGKEVRLTLYASPMWHWELNFDYLKDDPNDLFNLNAYTDFRTLQGFYLQMLGPLGAFWFEDPNDNTVTGQVIGVGDGTTTQFQLVRDFGGFLEPIQALNGPPTIYDNGVVSSSYAVSPTGLITFVTPPAAGHNITADFNFYFLVRFEDQQIGFDNVLRNLWQQRKIKIVQVKQ